MKWLYVIAFFSGLGGSVCFAAVQNIYFELIALFVTICNGYLFIRESEK